VSDRIWDVLHQHSAQTGAFMHGFTYSGHPVACEAGLAVLDIMEREDIVTPVPAKGERLISALRERLQDNPFVGDVRGAGLMVGVEFVADRKTKRMFAGGAGHKIVAAKARDAGVLTRALPWMPVTSFSPPLTISDAQIDQAVDLYATAVAAAMPELEKAAKA
jgi:adenosylmethionine-8-amino-7-oxononanoate aminotransferase